MNEVLLYSISLVYFFSTLWNLHVYSLRVFKHGIKTCFRVFCDANVSSLMGSLLVFLSSQGEGVPLLQEEKNEIEALLPPTTSEEDKEKMFSILGQALCRPTGIQVNSLLLLFD